MMTSQNLDILRLKLAFRLEKNCQCIPDLDIHEWYSYQHKSLIYVYNRCKSVLDSRVTLLGIYQPSILSSYLKFYAVCSSGTVKTETEKNLFSNFIFDVSLGNERQASSENTVTWEGNQPRSRTVKRSSTDLTELIEKLRSVNWINPINYCVTKRRNA